MIRIFVCLFVLMPLNMNWLIIDIQMYDLKICDIEIQICGKICTGSKNIWCVDFVCIFEGHIFFSDTKTVQHQGPSCTVQILALHLVAIAFRFETIKSCRSKLNFDNLVFCYYNSRESEALDCQGTKSNNLLTKI